VSAIVLISADENSSPSQAGDATYGSLSNPCRTACDERNSAFKVHKPPPALRIVFQSGTSDCSRPVNARDQMSRSSEAPKSKPDLALCNQGSLTK
jgi:hypothetical protein